MATEEENKNQDELNKKLERENQILREKLGLQSESLDLSSSLLDSLKETLGIQSKRTTFESNLLGINKQINSAIKNQNAGSNNQKDISKKILENQKLINKSTASEISLQKSIRDGKQKEVKSAIELFTAQQDLQKELEHALNAGERNEEINQTLVESTQRQIALNEETLSQNIDGLSSLEQQYVFNELNRKELEKQNGERAKELANLELIDKKLGAFSGVLKGLSKIPIISDAVNFEESLKAAREETDKTKSGLKGFGAGLKSIGGQIKENMLNPVNLVSGAMVLLGKALLDSDKSAGELAKNLGISYQESLGLASEASSTAKSFGDILVTSSSIIEAQKKLNAEFGTSVKFSMDMAAEFASIQKRTGLSDKAMGFFARTSMQAGKSIKDTLKDVNATVLEQNKQNKLSFSVKEIQEAIANTSSRTQLIFKGNVEELSKAVIQAKMLGVSMEQLNSIAGILLDFEGSIAAELEAELLTGKQLNLERARAAALSNDMVTLAQELKKQNIDAASFGSMNRIQQEATAKALGMSVEEMSEMLINQQKLSTVQNAFGKDIKNMSEAQAKYNKLRAEGLSAEEASKDISDLSLKNQLESASQAEKFEGIMSRVQEIFVSMATPILGIFETMSSIVGGAENLAGILTGIAITYGVIKAAQQATLAFKAADLAYQTTKAAILKSSAIAALTTASAATFGIGTLAIVGAVAAAVGAIGAMAFMDDGVIGPDGGMIVSGPKGSIQLNKDDSIIAGTDLGGGNSQTMSMIKRELARQNQLLQRILDKDTNVYMDGNKVGTQLALSNPRMQ